MPRKARAGLHTVPQSRDQVLQEALSGVSVRDQARFRFLLGRLQRQRDSQELRLTSLPSRYSFRRL